MAVLENWQTGPLRALAATLITLSGATHVATLWMWPLGSESALTAACGSIYLFLGIGLFGLSRTALVLGVGLPLVRSLLVLWTIGFQDLQWLGYGFLTVDSLVISLCAVILQRVRHMPSL